MTDAELREKVVQGLELCLKGLSDLCPYKDSDAPGGCRDALMYDAMMLLKAQEPVKPVPAIDDVGDWLCGNCYQSVVGKEELDASGFVPVKFNFCPNCGRVVKYE